MICGPPWDTELTCPEASLADGTRRGARIVVGLAVRGKLGHDVRRGGVLTMLATVRGMDVVETLWKGFNAHRGRRLGDISADKFGAKSRAWPSSNLPAFN